MINATTIALSGLNAASQRLSASASNIANVQTVGSLEAGGQAPYTPRGVQQSAVTGAGGEAQGVRAEIVPKGRPFIPAYSPDSPFADEKGIIGVPNVNLAEEIVNMKVAEYSFKASAAVIRAEGEMSDELLRAFDKKV